MVAGKQILPWNYRMQMLILTVFASIYPISGYVGVSCCCFWFAAVILCSFLDLWSDSRILEYILKCGLICFVAFIVSGVYLVCNMDIIHPWEENFGELKDIYLLEGQDPHECYKSKRAMLMLLWDHTHGC
jgi:hypothetical protein